MQAVVVVVIHIENRMAAFVCPFVEKPVEIVTRRLAYGIRKVMRIDILMLEIVDVVSYCFEKQLIAENSTKHVQHVRTAGINVNAEKIYRIVVAIINCRLPRRDRR